MEESLGFLVLVHHKGDGIVPQHLLVRLCIIDLQMAQVKIISIPVVVHLLEDDYIVLEYGDFAQQFIILIVHAQWKHHSLSQSIIYQSQQLRWKFTFKFSLKLFQRCLRVEVRCQLGHYETFLAHLEYE